MNYLNKTQKNLIYELVYSYLELNPEQKPKSSQYQLVKTITEAAIKQLEKTKDPLLKEWPKNTPLNSVQKEKIINAVKKVLINAKTPWNPQFNIESKIQKLFFNVMRGNIPKAREMLKQRSIASAVVWKKNPELLKEGRQLITAIFSEMIEEINRSPLSETESFHMEMIVGDLLSLYPFLDPQENENLSIPLRIDGRWQLVPYRVKTIKLTPKWMGSPLVAIGLKPQNPSHPPLLLFKGTTYPTDKGFSLSLITDLNPMASVGSYAFKLGRKKISQWLNEHAGEKKAIIYGKSLGGAQAWRTAINFPNRVDKVMAYGAPGLSTADEKKLNRVLKNPQYQPEINMFCQKGDPVPYFDKAAKKGFNYYQVLGGKSRWGVLAHADMYSTHKHSAILKLDNFQIENKWKRLKFNILRTLLSFSVFPFLVSKHAFQTAARETVRLIDKHVFKKLSGVFFVS